jgi:hypothetical protein
MSLWWRYATSTTIPHQQSSKGSLGDSLNGGSPRGGSLDGDPHGGPPPNPVVGTYGWPTPNPRMFIPPWYPPIIVQPKSISKLPYIKFQYPTYVKDIDLDVHIRIFKKMIKANGETMQTNIMNLFNFTLRNNISE